MPLTFMQQWNAWIICFLLGSILWCQGLIQPKFQGQKRYGEKELQEIIQEPWKTYLANHDISYVDDAAYVLLCHYRKQGHCFADVDYQINDAEVIFKIIEQYPVVVENIEIRSKSKEPLSFSQEQLQKFLTKPSLLSQPFYYKQQWESDVAAIHDFYLSQGYLQQEIELEVEFTPEPPQSQTAKVSIVIQEGPKAFLQTLEFVGNAQIEAAKLKQALDIPEHTVYTPGLHQQLSIKLRDFYRSSGYAKAKVQPTIQELDHDAKTQNRMIQFRIEEGALYRIRNIAIQGNDRTKEEVILHQLDFRPGDTYDLDQIRSSTQNLNETGLFLWADIQENPVNDQEIDLTIVVEERNARIWTFNIGYATSYGLIGGVEFEHLNIFGLHKRFLFSVESTLFAAEYQKSEASIQLVEPQLFGSRTWSATLKPFVLYEETPSFTMLDRGVGIFFDKKISPVLTAQFGYQLLWSEILDIAPGVTDTTKGTTFFSTLSEKFILNLRDSNSYPTSGSYHTIEFEQSLSLLGAEIDYFKIYAHTAWYFALVERCVLSVALRGGVIMPFGDSEEIPIQRRFFSGGVQSIRSFKEKQLPPWDSNDDPAGGEGIFLASVELRIPIYGNFGISTFGDAGQLIPIVRSLKDYRISHLKYAIGVSVWYITPIGPIRFDMGFNPDREESPITGTQEDLFAWFISIGFSF